MEIVRLEVAGHDWKSLRCGCGRSAKHLGKDLLSLARAETDAEAERIALEGHVWQPSVVFEPALPVVSVALAALADNASPAARFIFLETLLFLVGDNGQTGELARQGRDLPAECVAAAQSGIWLLYREVFSGATVGASSYAYEILTIIDEGSDRLDRVKAAPCARLRFDLR
ncbi:hypothetical protein [Micromonospora sp. RTGN7]|uniref:hypothetical protein n=1 Tax=Micromonospora sp. RTGN7 TaxID=3016526 RepID=UPI0029FF22AF|nr:hypothetical protein [Micromonospora sp. RTGN7]